MRIIMSPKGKDSKLTSSTSQRWLSIVSMTCALGWMPHIAHAETTPGVAAILAPASVTTTGSLQQIGSGHEDAKQIAMLTLGYFTSSDCTGTFVGTYTTPKDAAVLPIHIGLGIGLNKSV